MKDKDWIRSPLRISAVQCKIGESSDDIFRDFTLDFGFNAEQLNHLFKQGFQGEFREEVHGEALDRYLERAHAAGIREIVYFCLHELFESDKREHPEWLQRYRDGREIPVYGSHYLGCPNSTWRDYSLERVAQLARHDVDGIFLDGPLFYIDGCYCDACRAKFRKEYGKDYTSATFREYMNFRMDALTDFVREIREAVDRVKPGLALYLNNSALRADITGSNTRRLREYVDVIGAEGGFFVVNKTDSLYTASAMAKDIECKAEGKPTVIFIAGDSKPNSFYMHTAAETARVFAQSVSNGANVWYGLHGPSALAKSEGGQRARQFIRYLGEHAEYYANTRPCARIALMWSQDTANFYSSNVAAADFTGDGVCINASETRGDHYREFMGCYEMLAHSHVQFDVIDDTALARGVSGYDLIVLPCCACMSAEAVAALLAFAEGGGNVLATFETGTFDENGEERADWPLAELFGVRKTGVLRTWEGLAYMRADAFPDLPGILPAPTLALECALCGGAAAGTRYKPLSGRYEALGELAGPAIVTHGRGRGRAVLLTGNAGCYYYDWKDKNHLKLFSRYAAELARPVTETDAPKCVEITLRRQDGRYILHLVNLALDGCRPMDEVLPVRDFRVTLRGLGALKARSVGGEPLETRAEGSDTTVAVGELRDYLAVVLEK